MLLLQCAAARKKILFRELRIRAARGEGAAVSCLPERRKDPGRKKMEQDGKRRSSMEQKGKGWYAHGILKESLRKRNFVIVLSCKNGTRGWEAVPEVKQSLWSLNPGVFWGWFYACSEFERVKTVYYKYCVLYRELLYLLAHTRYNIFSIKKNKKKKYIVFNKIQYYKKS